MWLLVGKLCIMMYGVVRCGNIGVDMFLFLSGIGLWYAWTKTPRLRHFYWRRYVRIYPAWLLMAALFYIMNYSQYGAKSYSPDIPNLVANILVNWSFWRIDDLTFWFIPAIMMMYTFAPFYMQLIIRWPSYRWLPVLFMVWAVMVQYYPPVHASVGHVEIFWSRIPIFLIGINCGKWVKLVMARGCYWRKCAFCDVKLPYIGCFKMPKAAEIVDAMEEFFGSLSEQKPEEPEPIPHEEPEDVRVYEPSHDRRDRQPIPILTEEKYPELAPVVLPQQPRPVRARPQQQTESEPQETAEQAVKKRRNLRPLAVVLILCLSLVAGALAVNLFWPRSERATQINPTPDPQSFYAQQPDPQAQPGEAEEQSPQVVAVPDPVPAQPRYTVVRSDSTWLQAQAACREQGGYLAVITSRQELDEVTGYRANPETKKKVYLDPSLQVFTDGDTISMAIGQSENRFTPMQMAVYTAALANHGVRYKATFLNRIISPDYQDLVYELKPTVAARLEISEDAYETYTLGMHMVTSEPGGSGYKVFGDYEIPVAAKTGTAQHGGEGSDHAAYVCYAPFDDPQIAVAIYVEKGAQGGALGNIARAIFDVYFATEYENDTVKAENSLN